MTSAELLAALVRTNLVAGAAIPAVLALRKPARRLFGANIAYSLWALAPAAALASLLPARRVMVAISPVLTGAPERSLAIQPAARAVLAAHVVHGVAAGLDPTSLLLATWLAGAILSVAFLVWRQRQFLRQAAQGLVGPAVVGVLWPRIVTPGDFEERYSADERAMILAHEGMHIARQDARINAAVALVQCGCWFNPLIHAAAYFLRIDQEIACDAAVQAGHPSDRRAYAQALIKSQLAHTPLPLGCYWPARTEHPLTERIAMLKQDNPGRSRRIAGAFGVATLALGGGFAAWAAQPAVIVPVAAAGPVKPASGLPPQWIIPAAFRGEWREALDKCGDASDPTGLTLTADHVQFRGAGGPVMASKTVDSQLTVVAGLTADGKPMPTAFGFVLSPKHDRLTAVGEENQRGLVRLRCPRVAASKTSATPAPATPLLHAVADAPAAVPAPTAPSSSQASTLEMKVVRAISQQPSDEQTYERIIEDGVTSDVDAQQKQLDEVTRRYRAGEATLTEQAIAQARVAYAEKLAADARYEAEAHRDLMIAEEGAIERARQGL